jgi:hypothetical protein
MLLLLFVLLLYFVDVFGIGFALVVNFWRSCPDARVAHFLKMAWFFAVAAGVVRCGRSISTLSIGARTVAPVVAVAATSSTAT